MIEHETRLRVRYSETDQMGYVYYGQYLTYLEVARTELIRSLGMPYSELERAHGVMLPVREARLLYRRPVRYDEEIVMRTRIAEKPERRVKFETQILNGSGEVLTEGWVELVFVSAATMRPCRPPEAFMELMNRHWETES